jgi:hypothetical protein
MTEPTPHEYSVRIAILETKLEAADSARVIQAKEYERRLQDLNHAHTQAMERNATFVSRELYDAGIREALTAASAATTASIAESKALSARVDALSAKMNIGIGILLTIQVLVFVFIEVWKK